ncbi:hypothetical protein BDZ97DRAFT_1904129 [Flammula alnicola]|nr:hypothetical protein BDZ97DRAFT_1904129 [Flammula alnicola]
MPSTTIQSRISAFEALSDPSSPLTRPKPSPSPSPPNLGRKTSLIDLKDWVVDDGPSPTRPTSIDATKTPTQRAFSVNRNLSLNGGPLISLESPPRPKPKPKPANLAAPFKPPPQLPPRKSSYTSLKSFASTSSQSKHADSLTVEHAHRYPPLSLDLDSRSKNSSNHAPSSSISSFHSVSLSSDTDPSTPGSVSGFIATFPMDADHTSPPANRRNGDADTSSLSESFEEVSTSSLASPATERLITLDWEKAMAQRKSAPPKLPERPGSTRASIKSAPPPSHPVSRAASSSGSSPSSPITRPAISAASSSSTLAINTPYVPRRAAPPPPSSRASDRSSIQSNSTTHSYSSSSQSHQSRGGVVPPPSVISIKAKRPTPVPFGVRKRYEAVFSANVVQRRRAEKRRAEEKPALLSPGEARGRRAVGWRGLSVDLITGDDMAPPLPPQQQQQDEDGRVDQVVGADEKLEGAIVKLIWKRSGLDKERLAEIWNECDLTGQGALSLEAFVKGMWRIDEELRRTQALTIKYATTAGGGGGSGSYRASLQRAPPKIPQRPRDILR